MRNKKNPTLKEASLGNFAEALTAAFALSGDANPEDQLKEPVTNLLKATGAEHKITVQTQTEAQVEGLGARPDIGVYTEHLLCGHIELKKPGLGADPTKLKGEQNKKQWEKFRALPNLIYTDGRDWALYRSGERVGEAVRLRGDPTEDGAKAVDVRDALDFGKLMQDFLRWKPQVPHDPPGLAGYLAPLARLLREEATHALTNAESAIALLRNEWRDYFFPEADDNQFADAYAQTLTYALLLARLSGASELRPSEAAKTLEKGNSLLAQTLRILGQDEACQELRLGYDLLRRSLEALDPHDFLKGGGELWLYFYEDFLAAYDPTLRKDYGVYYTPKEVVELQVRLAAELLEKRFNKKLGFADDGVTFLDPASGTGAYLLAATQQGLSKVLEHSGPGAVAARASQIARNMYGFEILVGPYAVAHLRLTQEIVGEGGTLPDNRLQIYLVDTLESPYTTPPSSLDLTHRKLTEERRKAQTVKRSGVVLVCLGNPPYDRQSIEESDEVTKRKGGWVRYGDRQEGHKGAQGEASRPIFEDFLEPARNSGAGVHLKNLYNDYVYFWRWGLWRLFEAQESGGVLTFITASSYLSGPGFVGMREEMRRAFDELWVIDLGGDNLGTRKTANVFAIQVPVAIAIGVRGPKAKRDTPAIVHYAKIESETPEAKRKELSKLDKFKDVSWVECSSDWQASFRPAGKGEYFAWPQLADLFPWQHPGIEFKRTWPYSADKATLQKRWKTFTSADLAQKQMMFRETGGRRVLSMYDHFLHTDSKLPPLSSASKGTASPEIVTFGFRSFDRQCTFADPRFSDRPRPPLWHVRGPSQLYLVGLESHPLGSGPAQVATAFIPDRHFFRGSYGGKDVIPLWRDVATAQPNITIGLLELLSSAFSRKVMPNDFVAYVYAILGGLSYTKRFWNELEIPGPRVPLTKEVKDFSRAVELGRKLLYLHTFGERFAPEGTTGVLSGKAKCIAAVPDDPKHYPENFVYKPELCELIVGEGRFGPVTPEAWAYEVSGLEVIKSWLRYRMKKGYGKKSSPLDDIRPERWTPQMTDELLELLWVLEGTLELEPKLKAALDSIATGPCFRADELPQPTVEERKPPRRAGSRRQEDLFDNKDEDSDNEE